MGGFVAIEEDETAASIMEDLSPKIEEFTTTVVAEVPTAICFERIPGQGRSDICSPEETITQGGGVCNLVAQAFVSRAFTADFAIQNAGGCRTDIFEGDFTVADAYTLLPFSNDLVTVEMTGAQIVEVLEQATEYAIIGGNTGAYPYAAGLRYDVDANVEVNSRLKADEWTAIDEDATYVVVTSNFLAAGGDGYLGFAEIDDSLITNQHLEYAQSFIDFASAEGTLADPPSDVYSTQSFVPLAEESE